MSGEQLKNVLDTINRVIDIAEAKTTQSIQAYQKEADNKIESVRDNWQIKYQEVVKDIEQVLDTTDRKLVNNMRKKYGVGQ